MFVKKAAKFSSTVASLFTFPPAINKSSIMTCPQEHLLVSQVWIFVSPPDLQWCHFNLCFNGDVWCGVFSCIYFPSVYLLWWDVYWDCWRSFHLVICLLIDSFKCSLQNLIQLHWVWFLRTSIYLHHFVTCFINVLIYFCLASPPFYFLLCLVIIFFVVTYFDSPLISSYECSRRCFLFLLPCGLHIISL
jgi:hypothetical protein